MSATQAETAIHAAARRTELHSVDPGQIDRSLLGFAEDSAPRSLVARHGAALAGYGRDEVSSPTWGLAPGPSDGPAEGPTARASR